MSEVATETQQTQAQEAPKVASAGRPERVEFKPSVPRETENVVVKPDVVDDKDKQVAAPDATVTTTEVPDINEDQLKSFFEKQGMKFTGIEDLKAKVNYEASSEPTVEQKEAAIKAKEKRMLDKFMAGGGSASDFVSIQNVANANETEFALSKAKTDLVASGYTEEEAQEFLKENYHQVEDAEIEQFQDETDKAYKKRLKEFFGKQLNNLASPIKATAVKILADLHEAIESEDLHQANEQTILSNIDEQFKNLPRKSTIEIGTIDGKAIPPVEYNVSESDYAEVQSMLKDTAQRNNFLYTSDGSLNVPNIVNVLAENKALKSAVKAAYHEGGSRQVAVFEKVFPRNAYEVGIGGANGNAPAKKGVASFGKPQRATATTQ